MSTSMNLLLNWTPARERSELGSRDIDHKTRGARVRAREAIESMLSELDSLPRSGGVGRLPRRSLAKAG